MTKTITILAYLTRVPEFGRHADGFLLLDADDPDNGIPFGALRADATDEQIRRVCEALGLDLVEIARR